MEEVESKRRELLKLERVGLIEEKWLSCVRVLERRKKKSRKELGGLSEEGGECWS